MAFKISASNAKTSTTNSDRPQVDYKALEDYIIETVDCEQPETLNGVIVGLVDLGEQAIKDSEYDVDSGDESLSVEELMEKYADKLAENYTGADQFGKIVKFDLAYDSKLGKKVIKKFVKQAPRQCVSYIVDFPSIIVDKGQFFGEESKPLPLRMYSGGSFYNTFQKKELVQNLLPLKWSNINTDKSGKPIFSLALTSQLHKMAVAAKLVKTGEPFGPDRVDELLGKTLQFKVQVGRNDKGYYFEKLGFVGAIQKKDTPYENINTFMIQFGEDNDPEALSQLRKNVLNTIMNAINFKGDAIENQLKELKPYLFKDEQISPSVVKKEGSKVVKEEVSNNDNNSDDDDWA